MQQEAPVSQKEFDPAILLSPFSNSSGLAMLQEAHALLHMWSEDLDRGFRRSYPLKTAFEKAYFNSISIIPRNPRCQQFRNCRQRLQQRFKDAESDLLHISDLEKLAKVAGDEWAPAVSQSLKHLVEILNDLSCKTQGLKEIRNLVALNLDLAQTIQKAFEKPAFHKHLIHSVARKNFEKRAQRLLPPVPLDCAIREIREAMPSNFRLVSNRSSEAISEKEKSKLLEEALGYWIQKPDASHKFIFHTIFLVNSQSGKRMGYLRALTLISELQVRVYVPGLAQGKRENIRKALFESGQELRFQEEAQFIDLNSDDYADLALILWTVSDNLKHAQGIACFKKRFPSGSNFKDLLKEGFNWGMKTPQLGLSDAGQNFQKAQVKLELQPRIKAMANKNQSVARPQKRWLSSLGCTSC